MENQTGAVETMDNQGGVKVEIISRLETALSDRRYSVESGKIRYEESKRWIKEKLKTELNSPKFIDLINITPPRRNGVLSYCIRTKGSDDSKSRLLFDIITNPSESVKIPISVSLEFDNCNYQLNEYLDDETLANLLTICQLVGNIHDLDGLRATMCAESDKLTKIKSVLTNIFN